MRASLFILATTFLLAACDPIALTRYSFVITPQSDACTFVAFKTTNTADIANLIIEIVKKHGARHFNEPNEASNVVEKPDQGLVILTLEEFGRFSPSETTHIVMAEIIEKVKRQYGEQVVISQGEANLSNPALKRDCRNSAAAP